MRREGKGHRAPRVHGRVGHEPVVQPQVFVGQVGAVRPRHLLALFHAPRRAPRHRVLFAIHRRRRGHRRARERRLGRRGPLERRARVVHHVHHGHEAPPRRDLSGCVGFVRSVLLQSLAFQTPGLGCVSAFVPASVPASGALPLCDAERDGARAHGRPRPLELLELERRLAGNGVHHGGGDVPGEEQVGARVVGGVHQTQRHRRHDAPESRVVQEQRRAGKRRGERVDVRAEGRAARVASRERDEERQRGLLGDVGTARRRRRRFVRRDARAEAQRFVRARSRGVERRARSGEGQHGLAGRDVSRGDQPPRRAGRGRAHRDFGAQAKAVRGGPRDERGSRFVGVGGGIRTGGGGGEAAAP